MRTQAFATSLQANSAQKLWYKSFDTVKMSNDLYEVFRSLAESTCFLRTLSPMRNNELNMLEILRDIKYLDGAMAYGKSHKLSFPPTS